MRVMTTVSTEAAQLPLVMLQVRVVVPTGMLLIVVLGLEGVVMFAEPLNTAHRPVPAAGGLPAKVVLESQMDWLGPAAAGVGAAARMMTTVSVTGVHTPLLTDQIKVLAPMPKLLTVVLGLLGVRMVPEPPSSDQAPVPTVGVTAVRVTELEQIFWSGPALGALGAVLRVMTTVLLEGAQGPLVMVHCKVAEVPTGIPVTVLVGELGLVMLAVPLTTVQVPVP